MTPKEFVQFIDGLTHNKSALHSEDIREIRKKLQEIAPDLTPYIPSYPSPVNPWEYPVYPQTYFGDPPIQGPTCGNSNGKE